MEKRFFGRAKRLALAVAFIATLVCVAAVMAFVPRAGGSKATADGALTERELELVTAAGWLSGGTASADAEIALDNERFNGDAGVVTYDVEISTAKQLARLSYLVYQNEIVEKDGVDHVKAYNVKITADIDLENKLWIPIGTMARGVAWDGNAFRGNVIGAKGGAVGEAVTISNLDSDPLYDHVDYGMVDAGESYYVDCGTTGKIPFVIKGDSEYCYGIFGNSVGIGADGVAETRFENIKVVGVKIDVAKKTVNGKTFENDRCGALLGYSAGSIVVNNCVSGKSGDFILGSNTTGGLVGGVYAGYNKGKPSGSSGNDLGAYIIFTNCENSIDIGGLNATRAQKGGIVGYIYSAQTITFDNCVNYGEIFGGYVGGISSFINTRVSLVDASADPVTIEHSFTNCANYGDIHNLYNRDADLTKDQDFAGGILGQMVDWWGAKDDRLETIYRLENCVNHGNITAVQNSSVGGILGEFRSNSEFGSVGIVNCYNYGDVSGENGKTGGVIGYYETNLAYSRTVNGTNFYQDRIDNVDREQVITINTFIANAGKVSANDMTADTVGGTVGSRKKFDVDLATGNIDTEGSPKWYLKHRFDGGHIVFDEKAVNAYKIAASAPVSAHKAVDTATLELSSDGKTVTGLTDIPNNYFKVMIPATVEKIDIAAFMCAENLAEVVFDENGALKEIGDFAFAGTGISEIALPETLNRIGAAAFGECAALTKVHVPASISEIGKAAFGNSGAIEIYFDGELNPDLVIGDIAFNAVTAGDNYNGTTNIIAKNSAEYDLFVNSSAFDGYESNVTYPVTIRYGSRGDILDSEVRLFGRGYAYDRNNSAGEWRFNQYAKLGTAYANAARWYLSENDDAAAEIDDIDALLSGTEHCDTITLYSKSSKLFVPRSDIVYDGNSYGAAQLNSLLAPSSDKISGSATIMKYVGFDGTETENPASICDAGVYEIGVVEGDNEYKFDITVARRTFDLGVYTNLRWFAGEEELLGGRVGSASVLRSIARYLGGEVEVAPAESDGYAVVAIDGNTANSSSTDAKTASVTLAANNNYEFIFTGCDGGYGLSVNVADNGSTAYVFKTWYAVEMQNWFVGFGSIDAYTVDDRAFGDASAFPSPRIRFSDDQSADLSFNLKFGGESVNDAPFTLARFSRYLNSAMPAGKYELEVISSATSYTEYRDDGTTGTVALEPFSQTYEFEVVPAGYNESQLAEIDGILKGKTFRFEWDGNAHLLSQADRNALNAILERMDRPVRAGTVWEDAKYNDLYGAYELRFNVARAQTGDYVTESEIPVDMKDAQRYTVFYTLGAKNHGLSVDGLDSDERAARSFYVVNVRKLDAPTLLSKPYNGQLQTPDLSKLDTSLYTVTGEGGTDAGTYPVTLKFVDPECYEWNGTGSAEITLDFTITKASNEWIVRPTISNWVVGRYNAEENAVIGSSAFGYGDMRYVITDATDESKTLFDSSADGADKLASLKVGNYYIKVTIAGNDNYNGLESSMLFRVFKKPGMPWWGTLLIVIGSLLVAAAVIFILWKKGVFRIVTDKIILAVKTRASVDAVIASVRAAKRTEEARKSVEAAKRREKAEERRRKAAEEKNKPVEERAAALEAKAAAEEARIERLRARSEAMRARAERMREQSRPKDDEVAAEAAATKDGE